MAHTPKGTVAAERAVAWEYKRAAGSLPLMTGTVTLDVEAIFPVPKSWSWRMREEALAGNVSFTGKPDPDNIVKLVMDALNGVAFVDDCQVSLGTVKRRYGEPERVEVVLREEKAVDGLKTPAERRREVKAASGIVGAKRLKRRATPRPDASTLHAIGRRVR